MQTTALIIEYLVAGILFLAALILLGISTFGLDFSSLLDRVSKLAPAIAGPMAVVAAALAYAVGQLTEHLTWRVFEGRLDRTKLRRLPDYLEQNKGLHVPDSPLLSGIGSPGEEGQAKLYYGLMRFHIVNKSQPLAQKVEDQVSRLRLMRPLFFVWVILALAILVHALRTGLCTLWIGFLLVAGLALCTWAAVGWRFPRYCKFILLIPPVAIFIQALREGSGIVWSSFLLVALAAWGTWAAVDWRFERYCKFIERAYRVLVLEQPPQQQ